MTQKTPPELGATSTISEGDLLVAWSGSGPLKKFATPAAAAAVLSAASTRAARLALGEGETVSLGDYSGTYDERMALAVADFRTTFGNAGYASRLHIPSGQWTQEASSDLTNLSDGPWVLDMRGAAIKGVCTGKNMFDMIGSRWCSVQGEGSMVLGDQTNTPKTGFLIGRNSTLATADEHLFESLFMWGYFSQACLYNLASETNTHLFPKYYNQQDTIPSVIIDGYCRFSPTSDYQTLPPADTAMSCLQHTFIGASLRGIGVGPVLKHIYADQIRFVNSYMAGGGEGNIEHHSAGTQYSHHYDVHHEAVPLQSIIKFVNAVSSTQVVNGFSINEEKAQVSDQVILLDASFGANAVKLNDADISVQGHQFGPPTNGLAFPAGKLVVTGKVSGPSIDTTNLTLYGSVVTPNAATMTAGPGSYLIEDNAGRYFKGGNQFVGATATTYAPGGLSGLLAVYVEEGSIYLGLNADKKQLKYDSGGDTLQVLTTAGAAIVDFGESKVTTFHGPARLQSYTVAGVPSAATSGAGAEIYVSNESGGAVPAFSDGANWRRVTDRAIIS